jgi:ankyrin repeat protein
MRAALAHNHEGIVEFLLDNNADFDREFEAYHPTIHNGENETYSSSLEVAVATNNPKLVQILLDHGLEINSNSRACSRAIARALESQDCTMLEFLISKGADIKRYGAAALTPSINRHDNTRIEKTKILLKHGVNPNGDPRLGMTPLASSIYHEQMDVTKLLLESGCDVNGTSFPKYKNGSALHEAIDKVAIDVVKELISRGADVNLKAGPWGTPLAAAVTKGEDELFRLLLDHSAEVNPAAPYG